MVGVVLLSHGVFCCELIKSAAMIAGKLEQSDCVDLRPGEDPDQFEDRIRSAVRKTDTGDGVLVLVDMIGGTPFNRIAMAAAELNVAILPGMNLPMVMSLIMERKPGSKLDELAEHVMKVGQNGIRVLQKHS